MFIVVPAILLALFASPLIVLDYIRGKIFYTTENGIVYNKNFIPWQKLKKINLKKFTSSYSYNGTKFNETSWMFILDYNEPDDKMNELKVRKTLKSHNDALKIILEKSKVYKFEVDIKEWLKENPWFNDF